ncbi:MAG: tetratricopeptide repeat-containing sensor histidine kinase [Flavisolibacter sp.]
MMKTANRTLLFSLLVGLCCCHHKTTETEEIALWNRAFADSSYNLLNKDKQPSRALHYFDSCLNKAGGVTAYTKALRYTLIANYYYYYTTNNKATARYIDSALALYNSNELRHHYPRTYVFLQIFGGHIAYRLNEYNRANEYYFRAKKIADAQLDPCETTAFNYNIGMTLFQQQNYLASINYFKQAYNLQGTCTPQTTAQILQQQEIQGNIGECFVYLKSYDSAMVHFNKAMAIANQFKDSLGGITMDKIYGVIYGDMARVALAKNQLGVAERLCLKSIQLNDREGYDKDDAMSVKLELAEVYSRRKDFGDMMKVLNGMEGIGGSAARIRLEWNRQMATYYEQIGQPDSAIKYLKTFFSLNDSIEVAQKQLAAADVARQLKDKEQKLQITMLKKDNELALVFLWVTIVLSSMAVIIIYLVYQNYRRSKNSLAVSEALNEEIGRQKAAREEEARLRHQAITEAVIRAQETERSMIGLELHDNINQVLTTVKLHNEMVLEGVGEAQVILPRSVQYLQDCINEIRSLSKRLSAPTLGKISLEESVKELIDSINATSKVKITRQISGVTTPILKQELHIGLYRILQEQLNNVLKHSEASEVLVQLHRHEDTIQLLVSDNGKGFIVNKSKAGIGLMNMQTRAESLNGTLELDTAPGKGCKVKVTLPCFQ